jgi:hypothetical protein
VGETSPGPGTGSQPVIYFDDSFPAETRADLQRVAVDVVAIAADLFPGDPPAGRRSIDCFRRESGPITIATDPARYRVGLSVVGRRYAQLAYQLGHEMGHIYLDPRRTNGLLETLAVAVSLEILDAMATRWSEHPPHPHWQSYAPEFRRYREHTEARYLAKFPVEVQTAVREQRWRDVARYLTLRRDDQDANAIDRSLNVLGALTLRAQPVRWRNYIGVGSHTNPPPDSPTRFRDDLQVDLAQTPALLPDMRRIGRALASAVPPIIDFAQVAESSRALGPQDRRSLRRRASH